MAAGHRRAARSVLDGGEHGARLERDGVRGDQTRLLKRQLSLPVSTMSQWWVKRSSSAVVILASPKTLGHSPKAKLVVTMTEVRSYSRLTRWNRSWPPDWAKGR